MAPAEIIGRNYGAATMMCWTANRATGRQAKTFRVSGFTLIELMIVVVIVAILAAIAYPSYQRHMMGTRRSDAQVALMRLANLQEKFFSECNSYATSLTADRNCDDLGLAESSTASPNGYYQLGLNASTLSYTLTATPIATGPQAADAECTAFSLTHAGAKNASGSNTSRCWRK